MLPIIAMYLIQAFLVLLGVFFLIGLICTIVGAVKIATSYECDEGQSYKDLKKSILVDKEITEFYDKERDSDSHKKVAKHTRVK